MENPDELDKNIHSVNSLHSVNSPHSSGKQYNQPSGFDYAGLLTGGLGLLFCFVPLLGILFSLTCLLFGIQSKKQGIWLGAFNIWLGSAGLGVNIFANIFHIIWFFYLLSAFAQYK